MKWICLLTAFLVGFIQQAISQQVVTAVSESKYVNITKDPSKPPYLEIVPNSIKFSEPGGNNMIDANEQATVSFSLINSGSGPGLGLKLLVKETNGLQGLEYPTEKNIPDVEIGKTVDVSFPISGKINTTDGNANFTLSIKEPNGFGVDPFHLEVRTRAFVTPQIAVVSHKVSSQDFTSIQKRRPFDLQVLVQNIGNGKAENIHVKLELPSNLFCLSANENISFTELQSGEQQLITYNLITNNEFNDEIIPIMIKTSEKYGKYAESKKVEIKINQIVDNNRIRIKGEEQLQSDVIVASLYSIVDQNIPVNPVKNPQRIALIIGNENYSGNMNAEVNVEFARNDAQVFRSYAISLLGVKEDNVFYLTDATSAQMRREIDRVAELIKRIGPIAELVFFYAGHGFPDEISSSPYLIPIDVDGSNLSAAIPLSEVYNKLSQTGASRITLFLDACFSGGGRNQGLLAARGVRIKPKNDVISGNMVVFSASSGEQTALPLRAEKHGLFTYYLLKKLQETKGKATYGELEQYLRQNVGQDAIRKNGKPQDPEVLFSPSVAESWSTWKW